MLAAVAKLAGALRPAVGSVRRARHGLRPGRLLQLRGSRPPRRRTLALRALVHRRPGVRWRRHRRGTDADAICASASARSSCPIRSSPPAAASATASNTKTSSICRCSAASPSRDCSSRNARATRHRASPKRRPACSTPSACRASACTDSSARSCRCCASAAPAPSSTSAARRSTSMRRWRACCRTHEGVAAIELNISCPNIKEGGIQFGCSLAGTAAGHQRGAQGDHACR